jgi:hypothetical protein
MMKEPKIAVIDFNILSVLGLKQILQHVLPIMDVHSFASFEELENSDPDTFFHYFIAQDIFISHRSFFLDRQQKTIVLTTSNDPATQPSGFHCLCINVSEEQLVRSLLMLEQHAHAHGKNLPPMSKTLSNKVLSDREIEVLVLIVEGYINKEIADHRDYPSQEYHGQARNEECCCADHLCRDAWICGYQYDLRVDLVYLYGEFLMNFVKNTSLFFDHLYSPIQREK